jgi:hypothetical protein
MKHVDPIDKEKREEEGCNQYASVQVNFSDKDWGSWIVCKTHFDKYFEIEKGKRK